MASILGLLLLVAMATGNIYLHNPRGSNNRLNEKTAARSNGHRLFNSQVLRCVIYLILVLLSDEHLCRTRRIHNIHKYMLKTIDMHKGNVFIEMFTTADCYACLQFHYVDYNNTHVY